MGFLNFILKRTYKRQSDWKGILGDFEAAFIHRMSTLYLFRLLLFFLLCGYELEK